ncbi:hypothetical protein SESBI_10532 [Sesbania bispinosa]|nr:hypothetical protein SESBI_10532 [Sesbania bispinosa]
MDASRVTQCLDSLWFYTNILTRTNHPLPSLTDQFEPHFQKPITPLLLLNQKHDESQKVGNLCHRVGEISSASEEVVRVMPGQSERKTERRKRRKWKKYGKNGKNEILGGLDLGFDVKEVRGFLKFQKGSYKYQMQQTEIPPFDDDVAMKQHLKSWAYAVACSVK